MPDEAVFIAVGGKNYADAAAARRQSRQLRANATAGRTGVEAGSRQSRVPGPSSRTMRPSAVGPRLEKPMMSLRAAQFANAQRQPAKGLRSRWRRR